MIFQGFDKVYSIVLMATTCPINNEFWANFLTIRRK